MFLLCLNLFRLPIFTAHSPLQALFYLRRMKWPSKKICSIPLSWSTINTEVCSSMQSCYLFSKSLQVQTTFQFVGIPLDPNQKIVEFHSHTCRSLYSITCVYRTGTLDYLYEIHSLNTVDFARHVRMRLYRHTSGRRFHSWHLALNPFQLLIWFIFQEGSFHTSVHFLLEVIPTLVGKKL